MIIPCHIPARAPTTSRAQLRCSTILSVLDPDHALTWVTHHGVALARYSLNFRVPMNFEASELPKSLVLGRDGNMHIRLTGSSPLSNMGSYNPPPLGARHPSSPYHDIIRFGPNHALTILFLGTHTRTSQWVTHHGIALACYSLNFGVSMNSEANELPKCLVLGRDGNIHIRLTRSSPLGDVGFYIPCSKNCSSI
ncbi:unnamed protein product [Malus baccata var. baccata]